MVSPPGPGLLVLSPHLDDAVLSCGGLIVRSAVRFPVRVLTFFTQAHQYPTRAARSFLRQSGWGGDPVGLYEARRDEDESALGSVRATAVHRQFYDALFRTRAYLPLPRVTRRWLPPEVWHRYPTYRWDIARGRVCRGDRNLQRAVEGVIREQVAEHRPRLVLAPLGCGRHVDHLIVRDAAVALASGPGAGPMVAFYSDYPYALHQAPDDGFVRRHALVRADFAEASAEKADLVRCYRTQVDALYPAGVPQVADELWWPPSASPAQVVAALT